MPEMVKGLFHVQKEGYCLVYRTTHPGNSPGKTLLEIEFFWDQNILTLDMILYMLL